VAQRERQFDPDVVDAFLNVVGQSKVLEEARGA